MTKTSNSKDKKGLIRIISGKLKGRRLKVLDSEGLRPTTDRVRETIFNWLMYEIQDAVCLDLFAGSGVLGIESLSRGAKHVEFVEINKVVANQISKNISECSINQQSNVRIIDALNFLNKKANKPFDIVFLDPPYASNALQTAVNLLQDNGWLTDGSLIYIEQASKNDACLLPINWKLIKSSQAGQTSYSLYRS